MKGNSDFYGGCAWSIVLLVLACIIFWNLLVLFIVPIIIISIITIIVALIITYFEKKANNTITTEYKVENDTLNNDENLLEETLEMIDLDKEYNFVFVKFEGLNIEKVYCYISENEELKPADRVLIKRQKTFDTARVINVKKFKPADAPYPIEKTKIIIRKVDESFNIETDITNADKEFDDRKYLKTRYRENNRKEVSDRVDVINDSEFDVDTEFDDDIEYDLEDDDYDEFDDVSRIDPFKDFIIEKSTVDYIFGNKEFDTFEEALIKQHMFNKAFGKKKDK